MQPDRRSPTYEDLLALPAGVKAELVGGEIVRSPAPRPRHSKAQGALRNFLGGPFDDDDGHGGPGGWWIFVEVDVKLGAHVVRPDLDARTLEALALEAGRWVDAGSFDDAARARIAPFEAVELDIGRLFLPKRG